MENNAMSRVISQYCGTDVTLDDILENRVTNEGLSLFNRNGTMVKIQKSKQLHTFTFVPLDNFDMQDYTAVVAWDFSGDFACFLLKIKTKEMKQNKLGQIMPVRYSSLL